MAGKAVTKSGNRSKDTKESSKHDHLVPVIKVVGEGHGDQGNTRDEVANIKEEETSEEGVSCSEYTSSFLVTSYGPQC